MIRSTLPLLACLFALTVGPGVSAQEPTEPTSVRAIMESEHAARKLLDEKQRSLPAGGGAVEATPLGTMLALSEAIKARDYKRAGTFLDLRYLPEDVAEIPAETLIQQLAYVWNRQNIADLSRLSDSPEGILNDNLPSYRDQVGLVKLTDEEIPVFLQRIPGAGDTRVWKISNATVSEIPRMWRELGYHPWAKHLSEILPPFQFLGMENWQVVSTIASFVIAWPLAVLVSGILSFLAIRIPNGFAPAIARFFRVPVRFFLILLIARWLIGEIGLSVKARIYIDSSGVDYLAWAVLLMGLITLVRDFQIQRLERNGRTQFVPLMRPFALIVKILLLIVLGLLWAQEAGYNMSTVLAGLGVGSLAVALAAQKTLENVIGALMLYAARPVTPGDLCRFGDVTGVVEEIGLRSTVIRTLNRSRVLVPNSMFSSVEIENISERDRIRYYRHLRLIAGSANQFRLLLVSLRRTFYAHPMVLPDTVSIRLETIEGIEGIIRIDAGISTTDYQEFLAVAEDLNLRLLDLTEEAGLQLTSPGQHLQVGSLAERSPDSESRAAEQTARWRTEDQWPFPDISADERAGLADSLEYPYRGNNV